jgi:hypothetical protein
MAAHFAVTGAIFPDIAPIIPCYLSFERKAKNGEKA